MIVVERAEHASVLRVGAETIEWCGPAVAEPDAPLLRVALDRGSERGAALADALDAGDASAIGRVVEQMPAAPGFLDALAHHCWERDAEACFSVATRRIPAEPTWMRALARVGVARGSLVATPVPDAELAVLGTPEPGLRFDDVRMLPNGTIVALEIPDRDVEPRLQRARLSITAPDGELSRVELDAPQGTSLALPIPARADENAIAVSWYNGSAQRAVLRLVTPRGAVEREWQCDLSSSPQRFSRWDGGIWIHTSTQHLRFGDSAQPLAAYDRIGAQVPGPVQVQVLGTRVLVLATPGYRPESGQVAERAAWVDLDARLPDEGFAWDRAIQWPKVVALLLDGDSVWLGDHEDVVRLDKTGRELARTRVAHWMDSLCRVPHGVVAYSMNGWSYVGDDGAIRASGEGREVACVVLADGTAFVSQGEDVIVIAPDGVPRAVRLPYDGRVIGSTDTHAVFGPCQRTWESKLTPDAYYAIDGAGALAARVPIGTLSAPTYRPPTCTRRALLFVETRGRLLSLEPRAPRVMPEQLQVPPPPLRVERGVSSVRGHTYNPRDDWPEPGIAIYASDLYARGCTYGGTTGVSPGPAVEVDNGAIAVLYECVLTGADWLRVERGSTVILVECTLKGAGPAGSDRFVALECVTRR